MNWLKARIPLLVGVLIGLVLLHLAESAAERWDVPGGVMFGVGYAMGALLTHWAWNNRERQAFAASEYLRKRGSLGNGA